MFSNINFKTAQLKGSSTVTDLTQELEIQNSQRRQNICKG